MSRKAIPLTNRFWDKVQISDRNSCWIWTGTTPAGYGQIRGEPPKYKKLRAHRVSYELHFGPIPKNKLVCHTCDNPKCVNPDHLFLGTSLDNNRDMVKKGRANYVGCPPKLSIKEVESIRLLRDCGETYQAIADIFQISIAHAHRIVNFKRRVPGKGGDFIYD